MELRNNGKMPEDNVGGWTFKVTLAPKQFSAEKRTRFPELIKKIYRNFVEHIFNVLSQKL